MPARLNNGTARIVYPGGQLLLPAKTPYDYENIIDNVDWYARKHGETRLEVQEQVWQVTPGAHNGTAACSTCARRRRILRFGNGDGVRLCRRCAECQVRSTRRRWSWW